jgi:hypothetical protein
MKRWSRLWTAIIGTVLLAATPALAQDETTEVAYGPIGFEVPEALGASVNVTSVPRTDLDPPFLVATIYGERAISSRIPRVGDGPTVVTAFRVADAEDVVDVSAQVDALRTILDERPELAPGTADDGLPFLPVTPGNQLLQSRPVYVDTPTVSGVAYLTAFEQAGEGGPLDRFPLTSTSVLATFQGLSADGTWYVSVVQELETSLFPAEPSGRDVRRAAQDWDAYLAESLTSIDAASPGDFVPSLDAFDALVGSLDLSTTSPVEPSPSSEARPAPGG